MKKNKGDLKYIGLVLRVRCIYAPNITTHLYGLELGEWIEEDENGRVARKDV